MKIMPETVEAMIRAGYRPPEDNPLACRNCPSVSRREDPKATGRSVHSSRYFCKRHRFYVHSCGYCPSFDRPFADGDSSGYRQGDLFGR